jgi:riboflavin synthase
VVEIFTGLVEEKGIVRGIRKGPLSAALTVESPFCGELETGESVAVNGACLTVTECGSQVFTADVMAETLKKTNLGLLTKGDHVNLERALKAGGRLGGHFVTGHVDAVGKFMKKQRQGVAIEIWIETPPQLEPYLIPQGSIALDGVSLTVAELQSGSFKVSLIPHTVQSTTLEQKKAGDLINIEADLLGKYVARFLEKREGEKGVSLGFLAENGFI